MRAEADQDVERANIGGKGRLGGADPFGDGKSTGRDRDVLDVLHEVAAELDCIPAQAALAWVVARPGVASTIVGARTVEQLKGNVAATRFGSSGDQIARLNGVGAPKPGFTSRLAASPPRCLAVLMIQRMLHGGQDVTWLGE